MSATAADSKTSYFFDKLHSLSGVIPIGAFLLEHFWSNSYVLVSVPNYNDISVELQSIPWRISSKSRSLAAHSFPWFLRNLYLVDRQVQRHRPSVDGQLDVRAAALDRHRAFRVHHLARVDRTLRHATDARHSPASRTISRIPITLRFMSSEFLRLRFIWATESLIFAANGELPSRRAATRRRFLGALVGVIFSVAGLLIIAGFVYNWHPFSGFSSPIL